MDLTAENYYGPEAAKEYWSASQVKAFLNCPAQAVAELNGQYERPWSTALLEGGYVDAHFSGEAEQFMKEHKDELYTRRGALRSEFVRADMAIERMERDEFAMALVNASEKQTILTGHIGQYPFRAKPDFILPAGAVDAEGFRNGAIIDLKYVRDFEPMYKRDAGRLPFIEYWKYDLQLAIYQFLYDQQFLKALPCYILAVTKQDPPDLQLFRIGQESMDMEIDSLVNEWLPMFDPMKKGETKPDRCESCAYCRGSRTLKGALSPEIWGLW